MISQKNGKNFLIDGQQRLTSLTLLLIYLHHLQSERAERVDVAGLVFSERYGEKSFNIDIPERRDVMELLFEGLAYEDGEHQGSVANIVARYEDIETLFPETLSEPKVLPYFVDWLLDNVDLVEIVAYNDEDAYTIFETMNDRGLSLSPTDMLKGYVLANIDDDEATAAANELWRRRLLELVEISKDDEGDFFKAWLRAQYAKTIRERRKGSSNEDFEHIGTGFHKWVRDQKETIGLQTSADYRSFVELQFRRFSEHYLKARRAAQTLTPGLEYVYYNAVNNFTLQYPLLLAPLRAEDDSETAERKMRLVAGYIDIYVARRVVNFRTLGYSSIVYTMFNLIKDLRGLDVPQLIATLKQKVAELDAETPWSGVSGFYLNQWCHRYIHLLLARLTNHIEQMSGMESSFATYASRSIKDPFEIEHVWADIPARHTDEFPDERDFRAYRNRFGGLVLAPASFNRSYGAMPYPEKVQHYNAQNLLARSLHPQCYENNPGFLRYLSESGLPFKPYPSAFTKADLDERQELYRLIAEQIWSVARFDAEADQSGERGAVAAPTAAS